MNPLPFYAVDLLLTAKAVLDAAGGNVQPCMDELYAAVCAFEVAMPKHEGEIVERLP
ncbi:hypothetical protein [Silvimonas soli]|uniref:hypothetical protein n=1 Tax=Silvimonas soli TaxID=2980100 RepID=UPI0024B3BD0A|nr:hypothetical protein [Silvimonas soli]